MTRTLLPVLVVLSACGVERPSATSATFKAPMVSCPTSPAAQVFSQALCLCGDYQAVGQGLWVKGATPASTAAWRSSASTTSPTCSPSAAWRAWGAFESAATSPAPARWRASAR